MDETVTDGLRERALGALERYEAEQAERDRERDERSRQGALEALVGRLNRAFGFDLTADESPLVEWSKDQRPLPRILVDGAWFRLGTVDHALMAGAPRECGHLAWDFVEGPAPLVHLGKVFRSAEEPRRECLECRHEHEEAAEAEPAPPVPAPDATVPERLDALIREIVREELGAPF